MTNSRTYRIASIPGDGIGKEVVPAAREALDAAASLAGFTLEWTSFPWGCEHYLETGRMMDEDGLAQLRGFDSVFLGAVGWPTVPDHVSLWGLLIPIRRGFEQYVNLRPIRVLSSLESPIRRRADEIDFVVIRENNEGEYSEVGGRLYAGTEHELAVQEAVFTRRGTERVMRYAFDLAAQRAGKLASATKSNGIRHTMPFWDEIFAEVGDASYPNVVREQYHVDALAALFVLDPARFDVIVASNLFGDILTDLGSAIAGSIGIGPSANLNPEGDYPSMFEPIHGSAPDIAGQGIANPVGQLWAGALMLQHLGEPDAGRAVLQAVESVLADPVSRTPDLGGSSTTRVFVQRLVDEITLVHPGVG